MKVEFKFVPKSGFVLVKNVFLRNENKLYNPETGALEEQELADHEKLHLVKIDHNIVRALGKMAGKTVEEAFLFVEELANKRLKNHELQNAEAFKNAFIILNSVKKSQPVQNIAANDFLIIPASFEAYSKDPNELTDKDLKLVKLSEYANDFLYKHLAGKSIVKIIEILSMEVVKYSKNKRKEDDDGHLQEEYEAIKLLGQIFGLPNKKFWE